MKFTKNLLKIEIIPYPLRDSFEVIYSPILRESFKSSTPPIATTEMF